jgi:transposase
MYLRHSTFHKNGKTHTYWRLVKSVRIGKKVRQETVAELGELTMQGRLHAQALAKRLGADRPPQGLFEAPIEKEVAAIRLNAVALERVRRFGDVWLGTTLWRMAGLDTFFAKHLVPGKEEVPWATMSEILSVARLCEPSSELHIAEDWLRKTALTDILGVSEEKINEQRLYRGLDKVLPLKEKLEDHLKGRWQTMFNVSYDLLLYDVTSTYFEGQANKNPQAQRGHSRDHRSDCKQVCVGLIVTRQGMPLGYEQFAGNVHDSKTVKAVVEKIEARYGKANRIWIWDRGMLSHDLILWMQQGGRRYIMGLPKSELNKHEAVLAQTTGWTAVRDGVEVRYVPVLTAESHPEQVLLVRSQERREKEAAMQTLFAERIEQALERLFRRREKAQKPLDVIQVQRQIGRILQRNSRAAALFEIQCQSMTEHPSGISLTWACRLNEHVRQRLSQGCYALATNVVDWTPGDVWKAYIQLTDVEDAFRMQKWQLEMRPIHHQKESRTQAHILICFLAYVLWKVLEQWQSQAGLGNSPRTMLEELGHVHSGDIVLPTTTGERIRLRSIVKPEKAQQIILERLGIQLPRRMRIPDLVAQM